MPETTIANVLQQLNLQQENPGAYLGNPNTGKDGWSTARGKLITSINPATGNAIASLWGCSAGEYAQVIDASSATFARWRLFPAPKRGEVIRQIADVLREHKDALGSLVALETG
jgi:aldehyde dehydrogenase (NAD+)